VNREAEGRDADAFEAWWTRWHTFRILAPAGAATRTAAAAAAGAAAGTAAATVDPLEHARRSTRKQQRERGGRRPTRWCRGRSGRCLTTQCLKKATAHVGGELVPLEDVAASERTQGGESTKAVSEGDDLP
jgi:hypothetical protein